MSGSGCANCWTLNTGVPIPVITTWDGGVAKVEAEAFSKMVNARLAADRKLVGLE